MTPGESMQPPTEAALPTGSGSFGPILHPCFLLVPKAKARTHTQEVSAFERQLVTAFSGCTTVGETNGIWLDSFGTRWEDHCVVYMVAIEWSDNARAILRQVIESLAEVLGEQCIFLMVGNQRTFLIAPPARDAQVVTRLDGPARAN